MDVWQERLCSAVAALRNGCRKPINNKSVAIAVTQELQLSPLEQQDASECLVKLVEHLEIL
ncbi:hypothetical protein OS493_036113 [Desmophyllum pertusum]|uniref:Uncharacterized protein n=1 Tax=Desmophyllum pertusum TaxID=174260 RepID=A0A9W9Y7N7_9CNID|nr:hypothetical protein OS493_036113 [Desmophyllum pertusum]